MECEVIPLFPSEPIPDTPNGPLYQAWKRLRDDEIARATVTRRHSPPIKTLEQVKREHMETVLQHCHGNRIEAARVLGVAPFTVYRHFPVTPQSSPVQP